MAIDNEQVQNVVKSGFWGVVVGDALGVPVEFTGRAERKADPVTNMREYGTHSQPKGTWSDDSSMMLATADSIIKRGRIDYADIMENFQGWRLNGEYTPFGNVFDIGISCAKAISMYRPRVDPMKCGGLGERDNGNGSLMRIMPVSLLFAVKEDYWEPDTFLETVKAVQNTSALTHAHPRSMIACVLYTSICHELIFLNGRTVSEAVQDAITKTLRFYDENPERFTGMNRDFPAEVRRGTYDRLRDINDFAGNPEDSIKSSGYVVHTLEAAVWCLLNTGSYKECTLKAVNLGDDTDTVGAVAGGLAGLLYGYDGIPAEWLNVIADKERIEDYCKRFCGVILAQNKLFFVKE